MIKNDTKLKGFDDLTFGQHGGFAQGKARQARLTFGQRDKDNQDQFTISVVQNQGDGTGLYGHEDDNTYEVAMWFQDRDTCFLCQSMTMSLPIKLPIKLPSLCIKHNLMTLLG